MQRVYLLLRNNEQTGPFTIGELLQQQLRPGDMIWIEGKSTAWTYLSELELDVHLPEKEPETPPPVSTTDEIEKKAEELRQKVLSSSPRAFDPRRPVEVDSFGAPHNTGDEGFEFVDYRQRKNAHRNLVLTESMLTFIVVGLFIMGIYKGQSFLATKKQVPEAAAVKLNSKDEHAARQTTVQATTVAEALPDTTAKQPDSSAQLIAIAKPKPVVEKKEHPDSLAAKPANIMDPVPPVVKAKQEATKEEVDSPLTTVKKQDTQVIKKKTPPAVEKKDSDAKEEKKGFLRGLFKKKKKHDGE